ncbi:MAG: aminoacetone oxidase family FAD-binding enzyme [Acidobacteriota bacterium]
MIVVVGAGAAGLVAAIAARGGAGATVADPPPVTLVERTADGGRKILISGGGRCNVLPAALQPGRFVTDSPRELLQRMLRAWPLAGQMRFFTDTLGIPLAFEGDSRKYFPASNRARDVRDGLVAHARRLGVQTRFRCAVRGLVPGADGWTVETAEGPIAARAVVLATGGLSVPATGSDGTGLALAERLGHRIHATYAALTPLVADPARHADLSGVSLEVRIRARWRGLAAQADGGFLFTHRGYSGPAVLAVSHVAVRSRAAGERAVVSVRWGALDEREWRDQLTGQPALVASTLARHLPQRLAAALAADAGVPADRRVSQLTRAERAALISRLTAFELPWTGDEGYRKAEVTGGGVALDEVDPRTLESRRSPGLFFCGEILDAFGPIGGHNFAWAWATGRTAGLGAGRRGGGAEGLRGGGMET